MKARIACSSTVSFPSQDEIIVERLKDSNNLLGVSAFVLNPYDAKLEAVLDVVFGWGVPLFVVVPFREEGAFSAVIPECATVLQEPLLSMEIEQITDAAERFNFKSLPPFTRTVGEFISRYRPTLACPGHQGGKCLDSHPAGVRFKQMVGPSIFQMDVPHAAPELGDILCHEGPVRDAEDLAAKVFGSDETFFVLNGTSTSNKIVTSALLASGDFVLMDRNNHKSIYQGALIQSGAHPVYLENLRDSFGVLGGYRVGALDEERLRQKVAAVNRDKSDSKRPFRLAIIQHATCDGVVLDAGALVSKIGHLCDYILFDSAWSGYEQFVSQLSYLSPLAIPVTEETPGIIVTQSVHKQMSGFSQTSQIHKKDKHLAHTRRYCSRRVFNNAFMLHSSTSPFYPLFMSLEVNAAIHSDGHGQQIWEAAVQSANSFRSMVESRCRYISPYRGDQELLDISYSPSVAIKHLPYQSEKGDRSRSLSQTIEPGMHYLDPCKVIFTTKPWGIEGEGDALESIPASIVTAFLRENNFTPEKSDFYNFTLLVSPSTEMSTLTRMVRCLEDFERLLNNGASVLEVLPSLKSGNDRYRNLSLKELCQTLSDLYLLHNVEEIQSDIFSSISLTEVTCTPFLANQQLTRGGTTLVKVSDAVGKVAAEAVIPYPPGVVCIAPGEQWNQALVSYLLTIEAIANCYPEFAPHIQGVHETLGQDGSISLGVLTLD